MAGKWNRPPQVCLWDPAARLATGGLASAALAAASRAPLLHRLAGAQCREEGRGQHPVELEPGPDRVALVAVIQGVIEKRGRSVIQGGSCQHRDRAAGEQLRIVA